MSGGGVLDEILSHKRSELAARRSHVSMGELQARCRRLAPALDFEAALRPRAGERVRLIAEVKKASPSAGVLNAALDPVTQARAYAGAGAAAISVLTDEKYFRGSLDDLVAVRAAVSAPLLRKEFIVDEYQLWESRAAGADAVLLIVAALDPARLRDLMQAAKEIGLATLVEVHAAAELDAALRADAPVIGVNNRDLRTLRTSLEPSLSPAPADPAGPCRGERERHRLGRRRRAGPRGRRPRHSRGRGARAGARRVGQGARAPAGMIRVKVCGITNAEDARASIAAGADALGFNFVEGTPRYIRPEVAAAIIAELPAFVTPVGVFWDHPAGHVKAVAEQCRLGALQFHGDETPEALGEHSLPTIKVIKVTGHDDLARMDAYGRSSVMLDSPARWSQGEARAPISWEVARAAALLRPIILSAGLTPDNVEVAVRSVRPYAVDVASGVEASPGKKDADKVRRFVAAARAADLATP